MMNANNDNQQQHSHSDEYTNFVDSYFPNQWGHAMATTLKNKKGLVEYIRLYSHPKQTTDNDNGHNDAATSAPIAVGVVKIGNQLNGPVGHVHGGIVALVFDDIFGWVAYKLIHWCATKDLSIEYKTPQPHEQYVVVRVYWDNERAAEYAQKKRQRKSIPPRKRVFLRATCSSLGSSTVETAPYRKDDGVLYSTATVTMVQVQVPSARGKGEYSGVDHSSSQQREKNESSRSSNGIQSSRL